MHPTRRQQMPPELATRVKHANPRPNARDTRCVRRGLLQDNERFEGVHGIRLDAHLHRVKFPAFGQGLLYFPFLGGEHRVQEKMEERFCRVDGAEPEVGGRGYLA